jgi:hypothetical protein
MPTTHPTNPSAKVYAHTQTGHKTKPIYLGEDAEGFHHYIELRLTDHETERPKVTMWHDEVHKYASFSASGIITAQRGRFSNIRYVVAGQCLDQTINAPGLMKRGDMTERDRLMILDYWQAYNLNDMQPGCKHQQPIKTSDPEWEALAAEQTARCPEGYRYGSAWLLNPLPEVVEKNIRALIAKHTQEAN